MQKTNWIQNDPVSPESGDNSTPSSPCTNFTANTPYTILMNHHSVQFEDLEEDDHSITIHSRTFTADSDPFAKLTTIAEKGAALGKRRTKLRDGRRRQGFLFANGTIAHQPTLRYRVGSSSSQLYGDNGKPNPSAVYNFPAYVDPELKKRGKQIVSTISRSDLDLGRVMSSNIKNIDKNDPNTTLVLSTQNSALSSNGSTNEGHISPSPPSSAIIVSPFTPKKSLRSMNPTNRLPEVMSDGLLGKYYNSLYLEVAQLVSPLEHPSISAPSTTPCSSTTMVEEHELHQQKPQRKVTLFTQARMAVSNGNKIAGNPPVVLQSILRHNILSRDFNTLRARLLTSLVSRALAISIFRHPQPVLIPDHNYDTKVRYLWVDLDGCNLFWHDKYPELDKKPSFFRRIFHLEQNYKETQEIFRIEKVILGVFQRNGGNKLKKSKLKPWHCITIYFNNTQPRSEKRKGDDPIDNVQNTNSNNGDNTNNPISITQPLIPIDPIEMVCENDNQTRRLFMSLQSLMVSPTQTYGSFLWKRASLKLRKLAFDKVLLKTEYCAQLWEQAKEIKYTRFRRVYLLRKRVNALRFVIAQVTMLCASQVWYQFCNDFITANSAIIQQDQQQNTLKNNLNSEETYDTKQLGLFQYHDNALELDWVRINELITSVQMHGGDVHTIGLEENPSSLSNRLQHGVRCPVNPTQIQGLLKQKDNMATLLELCYKLIPLNQSLSLADVINSRIFIKHYIHQRMIAHLQMKHNDLVGREELYTQSVSLGNGNFYFGLGPQQQITQMPTKSPVTDYTPTDNDIIVGVMDDIDFSRDRDRRNAMSSHSSASQSSSNFDVTTTTTANIPHNTHNYKSQMSGDKQSYFFVNDCDEDSETATNIDDIDSFTRVNISNSRTDDDTQMLLNNKKINRNNNDFAAPALLQSYSLKLSSNTSHPDLIPRSPDPPFQSDELLEMVGGGITAQTEVIFDLNKSSVWDDLVQTKRQRRETIAHAHTQLSQNINMNQDDYEQRVEFLRNKKKMMTSPSVVIQEEDETDATEPSSVVATTVVHSLPSTPAISVTEVSMNFNSDAATEESFIGIHNYEDVFKLLPPWAVELVHAQIPDLIDMHKFNQFQSTISALTVSKTQALPDHNNVCHGSFDNDDSISQKNALLSHFTENSTECRPKIANLSMALQTQLSCEVNDFIHQLDDIEFSDDEDLTEDDTSYLLLPAPVDIDNTNMNINQLTHTNSLATLPQLELSTVPSADSPENTTIASNILSPAHVNTQTFVLDPPKLHHTTSLSTIQSKISVDPQAKREHDLNTANFKRHCHKLQIQQISANQPNPGTSQAANTQQNANDDIGALIVPHGGNVLIKSNNPKVVEFIAFLRASMYPYCTGFEPELVKHGILDIDLLIHELSSLQPNNLQ